MTIKVRKATLDDLDAIKTIADAHKKELGFIPRQALERGIKRGEILVAEDSNILGFVHYHHRRDKQTTLYHIAVLEKRKGIGKMLIEALEAEMLHKSKTYLVLKCPTDLTANKFYEKLGFKRISIYAGKRKTLVVWQKDIKVD